jgi:DNA recombination protein RmuC
METSTTITAVAVLAALGAGVVCGLALVRRFGGKAPAGASDDLAAVKAELTRLSDRVGRDASLLAQRLEGIDSRMTQTHAALSSAQSANQELTRSIFDTLGDVRRATTTVAEQAREFSALQDLLRPPKARGGLGEAMLEELLRQVLPPRAYGMQHRFTTGVVVDAVVRAGGKLVCIDSKFPLSNHRRMCEASDEIERAEAERAFAADVDRHIRDIAARYIVPDEGTFEFAVMYVPAEGLYGEILRLSHRRAPLFETALGARVVPMSPLTLYGYLQTILLGLRCLRIEENAQRVLDFTGRLQQEIERFVADYDTLGKHLSNARSKYEDGSHRLERFRDKLERVRDFAEDEERPALEAVGE